MNANNTTLFDQALEDITDRRGKNYGHPLDDFTRAAAIKAAVADCPDPELRHVLEMIGVKLARLTHDPEHLDGWTDIAGYARTACMVMDERLQRTYRVDIRTRVPETKWRSVYGYEIPE